MNPLHHTADLLELDQRFAFDDLLTRLRKLWEQGWQPLDVSRVLDQGSRSERLVYLDLLTADRLTWYPAAAPVWRTHADRLGATGDPWWTRDNPYWPQFLDRHGLEARDVLISLHLFDRLLDHSVPQPLLDPPPSMPGSATTHCDDRLLTRVRGLLAKAESTNYAEEARSFTAKAQELISRHSIDSALLADTVDVPGGRRVYVEAPYARAKFVLLDEVARANQCRCIWNRDRSTATLFGHGADADLSELLFTSLLVQGTSEVLAGSPGFRDAAGTRSWRSAFWYGFASRIGERLAEAVEISRAGHATDLTPVLAARLSEVDRAVAEAYPSLRTMRMSAVDTEGLHAGQQFANRATIDTRSVGSPEPRAALDA